MRSATIDDAPTIYKTLRNLKEVRKIVYTPRGTHKPRIIKDAFEILDFIEAYGHLEMHWRDAFDCWAWLGTTDDSITNVAAFGDEPDCD